MAFANTAQKGALFLITKGATPLGGFRSKSFSINTDTVDVTTADDVNRWRQLLPATAIKSLTASGSGVIKDTPANQAALGTDIVAQTADTYTLTVPGVGTFAGLFTITQVQMAGEYNAEGTFDITLESAGDLTFTAEG